MLVDWSISNLLTKYCEEKTIGYNEYCIHSNKRLGHLDKSFWVGGRALICFKDQPENG